MSQSRSTIPKIINDRDRRRTQRSLLARLGLTCALLVCLIIAIFAVSFTLIYANLTQNLPSLATLPALLEPPDGILLQPTNLYDRSGQHLLFSLETPGTQGRIYIHLPPKLFVAPGETQPTSPDAMSQVVISTTIAYLDPQFWSHSGVINKPFHPTQPLTLAERLVGDLLLGDEPPGLRKDLRQRLLAFQATAQYGREKILEWYANSANYGNSVYGIDAAARYYFGLPASGLTLSQAAFLAVAAEEASVNPSVKPYLLLERQQQAILSMQTQGLIGPVTAEAARKQTPKFQPRDVLSSTPDSAFFNLVIEQAAARLDSRRLQRGGLRIITSLDVDLQKQAQCTATVQIARLNSNSNENANLGSTLCEAARLMTTTPSTGASIQNLQVNTTILDPRTGQVLAMINDPSTAPDPAHLPGRPAGSLLTPFIYLTAFTRGFSPASLVWDIPAEKNEQPLNNFDGKVHGPLRIRTALANDYLIPALKLLSQVGPENVQNLTREFGISEWQSSLEENPPWQTFENQEADLLDVTQAYGVLANHGTLVGNPPNTARQTPGDKITAITDKLEPMTILRVEDITGKVWLDNSHPQIRPVVSPQLAFLINNILSDETARWTSLGHPNVLETGRTTAVKIGQDLYGKDVWTIGYTPQLVVGVWVGQSENTISTHIPFTAAAGIWHALIQYATRGQPAETWDIPPGVAIVDVCDPSGLLPTADCPSVVSDYFLTGNEPTQTDTLYQTVQVNRETNHLATIFTPPSLIDRQVVMIVPPEALDWARQAGVPLAPTAYDDIPIINTQSDVKITSPAMFTYVHGRLSIQGTAGGEGFSSFHIQVGQGLNPQSWIQIGQESTQPVYDGQLASWDTSKLNGLYAVQLVVVRRDQRLETATIQVSVDNEPPTVQILYPADGQHLPTPKNKTITFQISSEDNLAVQSVTIFVDDHLVKALTEPPFALPWQTSPGEHHLRVVATDMAGNTHETRSSFSIE